MPGPKAATGTINRFLSRREKDGSSHERQKSRDKSSDGRRTRPLSSESMSSILFLLKADPQKKLDKEQAAKVDTIQRRLAEQGYMGVTDDQITYALASKHAGGDVNLALELLVLFQESVEGVIKPYDPDVRMLGAENRGGATCYLDTVLFSMFARLPSFEPILYTTFEDEPRRRLSTLIRLWVNMLRTGKLIQIDITEHLQDALAACGWEDAKKLEQQDTSEAFHFITEKLQLPLLTLKMDIYHTGREDDPDDHKFVQERLLAVAVPEENHSPDGRPIKLEDCLEDYFNNRIEVRRQLERSNTMTSIRSGQSIDPEKGPCSEHVEELAWSSPNTPITALPQKGTFPASDSDKPIQNPESPTLRHRSESIIRTISLGDQDDDNDDDDGEPSSPKAQKEEPPTMLNRQHSLRKGSVRKEVLMPAWQFYNLLRPSPIYLQMEQLISWYTKHAPSNNAEVAEHFSQTQPVLGICLKRYYMDKKGKLNKTTCAIDVPLDIKMPHFVPDEMRSDDEPLMGNYKMSLQSFICHQGNSLNSGHYKCFVRVSASADGDSTSSTKLSNGSAPPIYPVERWIKFDDLGTPRVSPCDIEQVLKEETPYLLFYQVQPTVVPVPNPEENPPSYSDSGIQMKIDQASPAPDRQWEDTSQSGYFDVPRDENGSAARSSTETKRPRASLNLPEDRRSSVATDGTLTSSAGSIRNDFISAPSTPSEESTAHRMSRAAARFTKFESKSRPSSQSGENRISATFSRLALMRSKESLNKVMQINKDKGESTINADSISENRKSSSLEETVVKAPLEGTPTKKEKAHKRDKSKGATEKLEHPENRQKGKWKDKDVPDRECGVM